MEFTDETKPGRTFRNGIQDFTLNASQGLRVNPVLGTLHTPASSHQDKFAVVDTGSKYFKS